MIVDVSTKSNMSIGEAAIDTMRNIDAIVYEAKMGIMMDKYYYLAENGCVMEADAPEKKSIISRIREAIGKMAQAVHDFFDNLLKKAKEKIDSIKEEHRKKKAMRIVTKAFIDILNNFDADKANAVKTLDTADGDDEAQEVMDNFKKTCNNATNEGKRKLKTIYTNAI